MKRTYYLIFGFVVLVFFLSACTNGTDSIEQGVAMPESGYGGMVLAGQNSYYLDFNQADYEKALSEDKLIVLDFYATWCPSCKAEQKHIMGAFDELENDNVIGFRVNYKDSSTDDSEKSLAATYGVVYQHTKVFVKDGEEVLKALDTWDKERFINEINRFT